MKVSEKEQLLDSLKEAGSNDKMVRAVQEKLGKLEKDLQYIDQYLLKDLRISRFVNRQGGVDLVDELEKKEDEKIYEEWLDNQQKERDMEA